MGTGGGCYTGQIPAAGAIKKGATCIQCRGALVMDYLLNENGLVFSGFSIRPGDFINPGGEAR